METSRTRLQKQTFQTTLGFSRHFCGSTGVEYVAESDAFILQRILNLLCIIVQAQPSAHTFVEKKEVSKRLRTLILDPPKELIAPEVLGYYIAM